MTEMVNRMAALLEAHQGEHESQGDEHDRPFARPYLPSRVRRGREHGAERIIVCNRGNPMYSIRVSRAFSAVVLAALVVLSSLAPPANGHEHSARPAQRTRLQASASAEARDPQSLTVTVNAQVRSFLRRFTGADRDLIEQALERAQIHLSMIRDVFHRFGIPADLAFLAVVESRFDPLAVSRAGAAGLWQLMAPTARLLGLRVDEAIDERFDPEKSTVAAARHLRYLYGEFGSWLLAQAAYNAGEGPVRRAIETTRSRNFWALARSPLLAQETRDYVPQVAAAILIGREPERYGLGSGAVSVPSGEVVDRTPVTPSRVSRTARHSRSR
jgi:hypothetical protein